MSAERDSGELQRRRFEYLLDVNYQWLSESLDATPGVSLVFDVHTPQQEHFYIAAYQVINPEDKKTYREDDIALLAVEPKQGNIVGFSFNGISYVHKGSLDVDGVIATTENGRYYGYGLEAARQFLFGEIADFEQRELEYRIKEQFPSKVKKKDIFRATVLHDEKSKRKIEREKSRRAVWEHFYGANGVFGYNDRGRKIYPPTRPASASILSQPIPQGLVMSIVRDGISSSYSVQENNDILMGSAELGIQNKNVLLAKLQRLKSK